MKNEERWLFIQKYWSNVSMHWSDSRDILLGATIKLDFSGEAEKQEMFCKVFDKHIVEKVNEQKKES